MFSRQSVLVRDLVALFLFGLALVAVYFPIFAERLDLISHDNLDFFFPAFLIAPTLWEPNAQLGFPVFADPQFQTFYPLRYLFPASLAGFHAYVFSALVLGAGFAYRYALYLGARFVPAVLAGLLFGFSGSFAGQLTMAAVPLASAWLPAVLYFCHRLLAGPGNSPAQDQTLSERWAFAGLSLCVALACLAGHPQIFVTIMLFAGGLAVWLAGNRVADDPGDPAPPVRQRRERVRWLLRTATLRRIFQRMLPAGAAVVIGVLLAGVMIVPLLELLPHSARSEAVTLRMNDFALELRHIVRLFFPQLYGAPYVEDQLLFLYPFRTTGSHTYHELHRYFGLLPLLLWFPLLRMRGWPLRLGVFFGGAALLALVYALGAQTPLWAVFERIPVISGFRGPARHLLEISLVAALATGLLLQRYLDADAVDRRSWSLAIGGTALAISVLPFVWIQLDPLLRTGFAEVRWWSLHGNHGVLMQLLLLWAFALVLLAGLWNRKLRQACVPGLLALCLVDFAWNHRLADWAVYPGRADASQPGPALDLAADARVMVRSVAQEPRSIAELGANQNLAAGRASFDLYSPLALGRGAGMRLAAGSVPQLLPLYGVSYQGTEMHLPQAADGDFFSIGSCPSLPWPGPAGRQQATLAVPPRPAADARLYLRMGMFCSAVPAADTAASLTLRIQLSSGREIVQRVPLRQIVPMAGPCEGALLAPDLQAIVRKEAVGGGQCRQESRIAIDLPAGEWPRRIALSGDKRALVTMGSLELEHAGGASAQYFSVTGLALAGSRLPVAGRRPVIAGGAADDFVLTRLPGALPRAYFADGVRVVPDAFQLPAAMQLAAGMFRDASGSGNAAANRQYGPGEIALIDPGAAQRERASLAALAGGNPAGTAEAPRVLELHAGSMRLELSVAASRSGFLVINDTYYPGWHATVDGESTPIFRTNYYVRGVVVPAGASRVVLEYRPRSLWLGSALSLLGMLLLAFVLLRYEQCRQWLGAGPA